jgi:hypothetical protein
MLAMSAAAPSETSAVNNSDFIATILRRAGPTGRIARIGSERL